MKDLTQAELETDRPIEEAPVLVDFCLQRLYEDREHTFYDQVVYGLTFEELIGALLKIRDTLARWDAWEREQWEAV